MIRFLSLMLVLLLSAPAHAEPRKDAELELIKQRLSALAGDQPVTSVTWTPIPGIVEVAIGTSVMYFSEDLRYMLSGDLIDVANRENLSEPVRSGLRLDLLEGIGENNMVVFDGPDTTRTITVFTDVTCQYCIRLHREIDQLNELGIRVRYMFYPRAGKGSDAYDKLVSVWCAEDRQEALTNVKFTGQIERKTCDNPVEEHMAAVMELGLRGTPAIITDSGALIAGYMPAKQLAARVFSEEPATAKAGAVTKTGAAE